jgi:hypothetical protein
MRYYAGLATIATRNDKTFYDSMIVPPNQVLRDLGKWAAKAKTNVPVDVYRDRDPELTIYVDASAIGWAAISISPTGTIMQLARNWTPRERELWSVNSSVVAEAVALRNAVYALVPAHMRCVVVFTDHEPIVWAAKKTFGKAFAYSWLMNALAQYGNTGFEIRHVTGSMNPADELSRTIFMDQHTNFPHQVFYDDQKLSVPPLLPVTRIGGFQEKHKLKHGG